MDKPDEERTRPLLANFARFNILIKNVILQVTTFYN